MPRDRPRNEVLIVEAGCGTGSNLWFAAREGFRVVGLDGSASAISKARERFVAEQLGGDFYLSDFTDRWPLGDGIADLVIDRGSLTCVPYAAACETLAEAKRVLRPGGRMLFNPYSQAHTSFHGSPQGENGFVEKVSAGSMFGVGQLCFWNSGMLAAAIRGWTVGRVTHFSEEDVVTTNLDIPSASSQNLVHAEWRAILEKPDWSNDGSQ